MLCTNKRILLSVHVTGVLVLYMQFNNFALTTSFYWSYPLYTSCRSYVLLP